MKPKYTITRAIHVGLWDSEYVARVYADKIIIVAPYVKWVGNSGSYAEEKLAIRDKRVVDRVLLDLADDAEDSALEIITREIENRP